MDRLKASILECEKVSTSLKVSQVFTGISSLQVLPGCVTVLIEDVVSSVETRYR